MRVFRMCAAAWLLLSPASLWAAEQELAYRIIRQPVADFLSEIGLQAERRMHLSSAVRGTISNVTVTGDFDSILRKIAGRAGLDVFTFNGVTYVSSKEEAVTRLTRLGNLSAADAIAALQSVDLVHQSYPIVEAAGGSALILSGPPKMLALSEAIIETIPEAAPEPEAIPSIVMRRGTERVSIPLDGSPIITSADPATLSPDASN